MDALSTAIIMDLGGPVNEIINHIKSVDFTKSNTQDPVSLFETTIRYLGGLISSYDLLKLTDRKSLVKHVCFINHVGMCMRSPF
jgi:mannosyl-oligosaccharide alpha-1,2-mannosidase